MSRLTRWALQQLAIVVVAIVIFVVGLFAFIHERTSSAPPFALSSMNASATVRITHAKQAQPILDRLAGRGRLQAIFIPPLPTRQQVVGQVRFRTIGTARDDGQLVLFVIDNRTRKPLSYIEGVGPRGSNVAQGWDARYQRLADKYSWLAPLAEIRDGDGSYTDPGTAVSFVPTTRSPVTFAGVLGADALPVTDPARDLTFVLAYVGDERGGWAVRLPVSNSSGAQPAT